MILKRCRMVTLTLSVIFIAFCSLVCSPYLTTADNGINSFMDVDCTLFELRMHLKQDVFRLNQLFTNNKSKQKLWNFELLHVYKSLKKASMVDMVLCHFSLTKDRLKHIYLLSLISLKISFSQCLLDMRQKSK